jgi:ABC-type transport system involved in multi-copper enzyme maturation permease subunit
MIAVVFVLKYFSTDPTFPYSNTMFSLRNVYMQMDFILIIVVVFSAFMHDNEEKYQTIKHSIAFGVHRGTIYIGRFLVQAALSIMIYVVLVGIFTILSFALLNHANANELESLIRVSIGSFTCLLTSLAITHLFLMNTTSQTSAFTGTFAVVVILPQICKILGQKVELMQRISELFPINIVAYNGPLVLVNGNELLAVSKSLFLGALWLAGALILGNIQFSKKEIK